MSISPASTARVAIKEKDLHNDRLPRDDLRSILSIADDKVHARVVLQDSIDRIDPP